MWIFRDRNITHAITNHYLEDTHEVPNVRYEKVVIFSAALTRQQWVYLQISVIRCAIVSYRIYRVTRKRSRSILSSLSLPILWSRRNFVAVGIRVPRDFLSRPIVPRIVHQLLDDRLSLMRVRQPRAISRSLASRPSNGIRPVSLISQRIGEKLIIVSGENATSRWTSIDKFAISKLQRDTICRKWCCLPRRIYNCRDFCKSSTPSAFFNNSAFVKEVK